MRHPLNDSCISLVYEVDHLISHDKQKRNSGIAEYPLYLNVGGPDM